MSMVIGAADCSTGLSKRIYDNWTGDTANNGFSSPLSAGQATSVKSMCHAIAKAIVDEIVANAVADPGSGNFAVE